MFTKKTQISTKLSKTEILERLKERSKRISDYGDKCLFHGKIEGDNFTIYPAFEYNSSDNIRPSIAVQLVQKDEEVSVELEFYLEETFHIIFIVFLCMMVVSPIFIILEDVKFPFSLLPVACLIFIVGFYATYKSKVKKSIYYLRLILK